MEPKEIICDTDVMIDYWDAKKSRHMATKQILERDIGFNNVILSAITKMELLIGAIHKRNLVIINRNLKPVNIAYVNNDINNTAFLLFQKYTLSHGLQLADGIIAATAINANLKLFTYNLKDYRFITELTLFQPF